MEKTPKPRLEVGKLYALPLSPNSRYLVLKAEGRDALLQNQRSGWTMQAHDITLHKDGTIDWAYSTGGHFEEVRHEDK